MKFFIAIATVIAAVSAQGLPPGVAACSLPCWAAAAGIKDCTPGDPKCFCGKPAVQEALKTCVPQKCTDKADVKGVYDMANKMCAGATGFTPLTPPA
ncbi:hypothetical protein EG327_008512 [Venturia inaequalis]|uniref:CFEM domain-containing protein n=1 Tax=Venturia inaequalis TaxID=5025 RepID=A0A8H3UTX5_VENIN|nr:hypothetical protein EG327_008512 [Venturia inaequalis]